MSLLDKASLVLTPNAVKASKLYSVVPTNGIGDLTVVRNTTATRVNSSGLIESVAANVPRLNYDSVGGNPSVLVEPQRTNLLLNSAVLSTQSITTTAVAHTLSFTSTGTITLSGSFSGSLVGTGANNRVTLTFTPTAGTLTVTVSGSCNNAQIEAGNPASSYIPTTSEAVTRNADLISKTGISDLINSQEGCFFVEAKTFIDGGINRAISVSDGSFNNRISIVYHSTINRIQVFSAKSGSTLFNLEILTATQTNFNKIAVVFNNSSAKFFMNGILIQQVTISSSYAAGTLNKLSYDAGPANILNFEGLFKGIHIYKTALTDAECINLTT